MASGRWNEMSFLEKMSNIGSEVSRTITAMERNDEVSKNAAFERSLELFDLTLNNSLTSSQLKELCRAREAWVDFVAYDNEYKSTKESWRNYFDQFLYAYAIQAGR
ncbi:hypothetical protein GF389_03400 [Candidatus Dojkabacteria bacterium]|nr:hypothetical protein [Candidatus Dojkabacteria bacterium]